MRYEDDEGNSTSITTQGAELQAPRQTPLVDAALEDAATVASDFAEYNIRQSRAAKTLQERDLSLAKADTATHISERIRGLKKQKTREIEYPHTFVCGGEQHIHKTDYDDLRAALSRTKEGA